MTPQPISGFGPAAKASPLARGHPATPRGSRLLEIPSLKNNRHMQRTTMHTKIVRAAAILSFLVGSLSPYNGESQGTFVNLDFESAIVPSVPAGQFGSDVP